MFDFLDMTRRLTAAHRRESFRFALNPILLLLASGSAWAQQSTPALGTGSWDAPLVLKSTPALQENIANDSQELRPIYLSGDKLSGTQDDHSTLEGNAQLRRGDTLIRGDKMEYYPANSTALANGNVHINKAGDTYDGDALKINIDTYEGHFTDVNYRLRENQAHGNAQRIEFINQHEQDVFVGDYTTCQRDDYDPNWRPAWQIKAKKIHLDRQEDVGVARNAVLEFMGVPILATPYLSFPLSDKRKSGFLPPSIGLDSTSGLQYDQPYYFNIAPNRDATLMTSLMAKRGVNFGGQFRYLERDFSGEFYGNYMPHDRLRDKDRWSYSYQHRQNIPVTVGNLGFDLDLNRVGDNNYWRDFPNGIGNHRTERLLPSNANLNWSNGDFYAKMRTLKWQTLQDSDSIITPPYDILPQLNLQYRPYNLPGGIELVAEADNSRFHADTRRFTWLTNGDRTFLQTRVSRPFLAPQGFFTPSMQLHASNYRLDNKNTSGTSSYSLFIPTFSLDSGLYFEKDTSLFGRSIIQTLEPRAFYTYTPFRQQNQLPMYDTAELDFTFASIYTSNSFVGQDRFADNNLLTLGVNSKFIDPETGAELARAGIAQRMRFSEQRVTLPGDPPSKEGWSDILFGGSINWTPKWSTNGVIQYDHKENRTARYTLSAQYKPKSRHVISAGYRMKRDSSKQIDVGWQWPLNDLWGGGADQKGGRWYSVGRLNYSMEDKRLVDTVVGVEYGSCCWTGRFVLERLQNSYNSANTRFLFQIELTGLSSFNFGANPLSSLQANVPGYQNISQNGRNPSSRFGNYD